VANAYPAELVYESIYDFIDQLVEDSWPLANSFFPADPSLVIQAIVHGMAIMVTNGSYKPLLLTKIGAAAWILEYLETRASCFGECSTSGMRNKVNSYQSAASNLNVTMKLKRRSDPSYLSDCAQTQS
jgi:hypothetical protein